MKRAAKLIFAVTNDLSYDQRMIRICTSLASSGYQVTLVGRHLPSSVPLKPMPFRQHRIRCVFNTGFFFYAEFNIKLFFYLLLRSSDLLCAVDLDTILPTYTASILKNVPRVYDAHELFCEMKEVVSRPRIHRFWKRIEQFAVPRFQQGYTVSHLVSDELNRMYGVTYHTIRNLPLPSPIVPGSRQPHSRFGRFVLYQGAVNEGRSFETLIPAMKSIDASLIICGDGNFMEQAKELVKRNGLTDKVVFTGYLEPAELREYTLAAHVGVNILENEGLNNRFSLANRFFDYVQCALPQVCTAFPAYQEINDEYDCALLIYDNHPDTIANNINLLLNDAALYEKLRYNCFRARNFLNWSVEEKRLIDFYNNILRNVG